MTPHTIATLYGHIMAAARQPAFFTHYGLPDEFETRFELLTLHMFLVLSRLKNEDQKLTRLLSEYFVKDMDRTTREMGVGDVGVVKRMKLFMESFYGRLQAYESALASADDKALSRALDKNLYGAVSTNVEKLSMMQAYIHKLRKHLAAQPLSAFMSGSDIFVSAPTHDHA